MTNIEQVVERAVELFPRANTGDLLAALLLVKLGVAPVKDAMVEVQALALYITAHSVGALSVYEGKANERDRQDFHGIAELLRDAADHFERAGK